MISSLRYESSLRFRQGMHTMLISGKFHQMDDTILNDPQAIVDAFADILVQAFVSSNLNSGRNSDPICVRTNVNCLNALGVDENIVLSAIRRLKSTMIYVIKDCGAVLAKPLTYIFNLILKSSIYPVAWKMSHVTPEFKSGNRSDVTSYRPISLISNFSIFEHVLHSFIYPHVSHMISDNQQRFMKGRSAVSNLAVISQCLCEIVDKEGQASPEECRYIRGSKTNNQSVEKVAFVPCHLELLADRA
ncbi:hypothetical protein GEV33_001877 [Tenebrio molitor]|uniref:Reverse transcriptase domain-containing protein n=1 Tax=Tenebrio molitor TaxID=7067 RepID=A0A8J6LFG8_TENMO|nr:hypothetical protein GEV33_001877 [Tenebrio molitor]